MRTEDVPAGTALPSDSTRQHPSGPVDTGAYLLVLLLSISGLQHHRLSKGLGLFGIVVGVFGILTLFQGIPEFKDAFGLSQIVWLFWTGIELLRKKVVYSVGP